MACGKRCFEGEQRLLRFGRLIRVQPARRQQHGQLGIVLGQRGRHIGDALQRQRGGERPALIELIAAQNQRRFVAGFGLEISPRNFCELREIAGVQRRFERRFGIGAILQLVHLAAFGRHRAEQSERFGLQADLRIGAAGNAEKKVVAAGAIEHFADFRDGVAIALFVDRRLGPV